MNGLLKFTCFLYTLFGVLFLVTSCQDDNSLPPLHCFNGWQDMELGETYIDCGGICGFCVTCDDGIQNNGETGVDCGGPCEDCFVPPCEPNSLNEFDFGISGLQANFSIEDCTLSNNEKSMFLTNEDGDTITLNFEPSITSGVYETNRGILSSGEVSISVYIELVSGIIFDAYPGRSVTVEITESGTIIVFLCDILFSSDTFGTESTFITTYVTCN